MRELFFTAKYDEPIVLGLGFFDCVHIGHRELIKKVHELSQKHNAKSAITTFSNNPYKVFNKESKLIFTYDERATVFSSLGIDFCLPFKFDQSFKEIDRDDFLKMLFSNFNITALVCGYDYLFGAGGKGDSTYLTEYCAKKNIEIVVVEPVLYMNERVSSTLVKSCLENGEIEKVNTYLTMPYFMHGTVVEGRGEGRKIGIPTANLRFSKDKLLLKSGVYVTNATIDGNKVKAITSIGSKPTFNEPKITVETHILNKSQDFYGKNIKIEFIKRIRDIKKFDSTTDLVKQIHLDLKSCT